MSLKDALLAPESRERAALEQERMRETVRPPNSDPAIRNYEVGKARETVLLQRIATLNADEGADPATLDVLFNRLAEAYAYQGRLSEAALTSKSPAHKTQFAKTAVALSYYGARQCSCPETTIEAVKGDAKGKQFPHCRK